MLCPGVRHQYLHHSDLSTDWLTGVPIKTNTKMGFLSSEPEKLSTATFIIQQTKSINEHTKNIKYREIPSCCFLTLTNTNILFTFLGYGCLFVTTNNSWFLNVCSTSLSETLQKKEKLLITSDFSFSLSVFYPFG